MSFVVIYFQAIEVMTIFPGIGNNRIIKRRRNMKSGKVIATITIMSVLILGAGLWLYGNEEPATVATVKSPSSTQQDSSIKPQPQEVPQVDEKVNQNSTPEKTDKIKEPVKKSSDISSSAPAMANDKLSWYYKPNKEHKLPEVNAQGKAFLEAYSGIYHGDINTKSLYLTFDEGYENGYTSKILDELKAANVKAAFFITGDYLRRNPELVKRMVNEGHIVGNHTDNHPSLPTINDEELKKEITSLTDSFHKLTSSNMSYLRPPMGEYSERSLKITHEMGYKNVFWSVAMADWRPDAGTPEENKKTVLDRLHGGAVILLHAVNKANAEMLPNLIKECNEQGYQFKTLDDI